MIFGNEDLTYAWNLCKFAFKNVSWIQWCKNSAKIPSKHANFPLLLMPFSSVLHASRRTWRPQGGPQRDPHHLPEVLPHFEARKSPENRPKSPKNDGRKSPYFNLEKVNGSVVPTLPIQSTTLAIGNCENSRTCCITVSTWLCCIEVFASTRKIFRIYCVSNLL